MGGCKLRELMVGDETAMRLKINIRRDLLRVVYLWPNDSFLGRNIHSMKKYIVLQRGGIYFEDN